MIEVIFHLQNSFGIGVGGGGSEVEIKIAQTSGSKKKLGNVSKRQGCRKLAPLAPPVPDKAHLDGQNEIDIHFFGTYNENSEEILSYIDMVIGHIVQ